MGHLPRRDRPCFVGGIVGKKEGGRRRNIFLGDAGVDRCDTPLAGFAGAPHLYRKGGKESERSSLFLYCSVLHLRIHSFRRKGEKRGKREKVLILLLS